VKRVNFKYPGNNFHVINGDNMAEGSNRLRRGVIHIIDGDDYDGGYVRDSESGLEIPFYTSNVTIGEDLTNPESGTEVMYDAGRNGDSGLMVTGLYSVQDNHTNPSDGDRRVERYVRIHSSGRDKSSKNYWLAITADGTPVFIHENQLRDDCGNGYIPRRGDILVYDDSSSRDFRRNFNGMPGGDPVYRGSKIMRFAKGIRTLRDGETVDAQFPEFPVNDSNRGSSRAGGNGGDIDHDNNSGNDDANSGRAPETSLPTAGGGSGGSGGPGDGGGSGSGYGNGGGSGGDDNRPGADDGNDDDGNQRGNRRSPRRPSYTPVSRRIRAAYDGIRSNLQDDDLEGQLRSYMRQLDELNSVDETQYTHNGQMQYRMDIAETEDMIRRLRERMRERDRDVFFEELRDMRTVQLAGIPNRRPWGSRRRRQAARSITDSLRQLDILERRWLETASTAEYLSDDQRAEEQRRVRRAVNEYRTDLGNRWTTMSRRPWIRRLV